MNERLRSPLYTFQITMIFLLLSWSMAAGTLAVRAEGETPPPTPEPAGKYFSSEVITTSDGILLEKITIGGPPEPPPSWERLSVSTDEIHLSATSVLLEVPAYDWYFGCSATSAAMIAAYYDRNGYPNMYTGPTNGGVMPMDGSVWGKTPADEGNAHYYMVPLTASCKGLDGRTTRGSYDDYWYSYLSGMPDPFIRRWTEHAYGDAIGDYMRTSQSSFENDDGVTYFYLDPHNAMMTCVTMEGLGIQDDGSLGRKLFYQARGYGVIQCYNLKVDSVSPGGFTFAQYKAEIDAGRPVFLDLVGHSIVGIGYDSDIKRVYLNDTWDFSTGTTHYMEWGGSYAGMDLLSVSMVTLGPPIHMLSVSKVGTGSGSVTSDPSGISCGTDCTESYAPSTVVKLTTTATSGSLFTGWSGAGCSGTGDCYVTMDAVKSVTATFTLITHDLTVTVAGTGIGTVTSAPAGIDCGIDCTESYTPGTVVKLTAAASPGSLFTGWSGAGCSGLKFCWVTMNAAKTVIATFTLIPAGTYPVTVVKSGTGSGTATSTPAGISCGTDCWEFYTAGTVVKLTPTASPGSTFIGWSGACGSLDYCWLSMGASKYVTANFTLTPPGTYSLLVAMKGKGTGTVTSNLPGISCWPDCYEFYTSGSLVRLAAAAAPGSTFTGWSGACGGTAYCWVTLSQARFVTANWVLNTASLPSLDADIALLRDPFTFFTFLTRPLEALLP